MGKGVDVFVVEEDLAERGVEPGDLIEGLKPVARGGIPKLFAGFDHIWHW